MRILLVNSLYHPDFVGGAERSVQVLAEDLAALGHDVAVACTTNRESDEIEDVGGVRVHRLTHLNRYWAYEDRRHSPIERLLWHARDNDNAAMAEKFFQVARRERPDVVHTNNLAGFSTAVWAEARRLRIPIVHTLRDYYLMCPRSTMYARGSSCGRPCLGCLPFALPRRAASRHVSAVVGISRSILQKHRANGYFAGADAEVIRTGFDAPELSAPREPNRGPLIVGYLGALTEIKGIEVLLRAVLGLPADRVQCKVGGTTAARKLLALKHQYDRPPIYFLGRVAPSEFLPTLDVLVVPSLWEEPLGRVVLEALSHGTPVIVTPHGGMPEVVRDGIDGIVLPDDHPRSIREALARLIEDRSFLRRLMVHAAERVETPSVRDTTERYLDRYQRQRSTGRVMRSGSSRALS